MATWLTGAPGAGVPTPPAERVLSPLGAARRGLSAALDYLPRWIEHQMRLTGQPGCALAVVHKGKCVLDLAFGHADQPRGMALTPRHRFRVASHSKSFTAAGVLKLRERGVWRLDDPVGRYVPGLHPEVAAVTLTQLLSHSAGLARDGADAGQWADRRPFLSADELRADLAAGPVIPANSRFKYSNHGFGLAGLAIEAVTGETYAAWIAREIVAASGLEETTPDGPPARGVPFAHGHSAPVPLDRRVAIPARDPTHAMAAATGFISTAADLARFFASLAPEAKGSVLSPASRREMAHRQWRDPHSSLQRWYGLGLISGTLGDWDWQGHSGSFPGTLTRTVCVPAQDLAISVLTNAADGLSQAWLDGVLHLLQAYARHGAPSRRTAPWQGRWWNRWAAFDLLPMDDRVLVAMPALANPLLDATEIDVTGRDRDGVAHGRIALAGGFGSHGEPVRLVPAGEGGGGEFWLAGSLLLPEAQMVKEMRRKYGRR
jgi:D-alanyl-D-alanine carboxypeptidase